jgi:hypothetical protein
MKSPWTPDTLGQINLPPDAAEAWYAVFVDLAEKRERGELPAIIKTAQAKGLSLKRGSDLEATPKVSESDERKGAK